MKCRSRRRCDGAPDNTPFRRRTASATDARAILAKTAHGAGWVLGWRAATRLLGLVNTMVLARLLLPADFGLVAIATGFSGALDSLSTLGVEDAIIRIGRTDRETFDTGFTLNVLRGLLTGALLGALSEPAAAFFHEPRLVYILLALACSSFVSGFTNIGTVEFVRDMTFDKEFRLAVFPRVLSVIASLAIAVAFRTYWALVAGVLVNRFLGIGMSYMMHPYRPKVGLQSWREIAHFSIWTWCNSIMGVVRGKTATFAIGRMLTVGAVGFYEIGLEVAWLPTIELLIPLCRACFPGFVAVRDSRSATGEMYVRVVSAMALFTLPAGVGITLLAGPIVELFFGPKWTPMVIVMEVFGLAGTLMVFGLVGSVLFSAHGMLKSMAFITATTAAFMLVTILLLIRSWGIAGAAIGAGVGNLAEHMIYVVLVLRRFEVSGTALTRRVWRSAVAAAVMAMVVYSAGFGFTSPAHASPLLAIRTIEAIALGASTYSLVLVGLWLLVGRPDGGEADLLSLAGRIYRNVAPRKLHRG